MEILTTEDNMTAKALASMGKGDAAVVNILDRQWDQMVESRAGHHRKWNDYGRLLRGDHWRYSPIGGDAQITYNRFGSIVRAKVALVTQGRVRFEAMANGPDPMGLARAIDARFQDIQERCRIGAVQSQILTDAFTYGTGASYVWWDEDARDGYGDHRIDWLDLYNLFFDPYATSVPTAQIVMVRKIYSIAQAESLWPEFKGEFKVERMRTSRDQSGLFRPQEDLPNVLIQSGAGNFSGSDADGNSYRTDYGWTGEGDRGRDVEDEVHVREWYIRSRFADATIEPAILAAEGRSADIVARQENADLARGGMIQPDMGEDHAGHLQRHRSFLLTNRERLTPEQTLFMTDHMDAHQEMLRSPEWRRLRASRYPGGWRMILTAGPLKLYDGRTLTGSPWLPVSVMKNYDDNGSPWGISDATDTESLQHGLNVALSQSVDLMRVAAHRPCMVRAGSGIKKEDLVAQVGAIIFYDGDDDKPPIKWGDPLTMDPSWLNQAVFLKNGIDESAGFSPASEGKSPFAGASGDAIQLLQQAATTRIGKTSEDFTALMTDTGRAVLGQIVALDTEPRMLKVQADPARLPMGSVPTEAGDGSFFVPINQETPDGPLNMLRNASLEQIDVLVNASGTVARGKTPRRNEIVGLGREMVQGQPILDLEEVRRELAHIGVLSPMNLQNMTQRAMQMQQAAMMGQAPPASPQGEGAQAPGASPPVEEAFGNFDTQGNQEQQQRG